MPFELKHIYTNICSSAIHFKTHPVGLVFNSNYPTSGTDQDERVGNKINLTSFVIDGFFNIVENSYPFRMETDTTDLISICGGTLASGNGVISSSTQTLPSWKMPQPWYAKFRFIIIKHKPDYTVTNPVAWFKKNFVYMATTPTYSNQCKILRESTEDTGKFSIIHDSMHKLSLSSNNKHISFSYKLANVSVNFKDSTTITPSNVQYTFMVIPPLSHYDRSHSITDFIDADVDVEFTCNLKLIYKDF